MEIPMQETDELQRVYGTMTGTVTVRDFDMPFWSMVGFMLKWAIAAIPAAVIFAILCGFLCIFAYALLGAMGAVAGGGLR
jgi:hypothetical protein